METQTRLTVQQPPRFLETVIEWLTPSPCRTEVLGDMAEDYIHPLQYLLSTFRHVPVVIFRQVRRSFNQVLFAAEVCIVIVAFGQSQPGPMLAVAAILLIVLTLCDAYSHPSEGTPKEPAIEAAVAATVLFLSQIFFNFLIPPLAMARGILARGAVTSLLMLCAFRMMFHRTNHGLQLPPLHALEVMRRVNRLWMIAAFL